MVVGQDVKIFTRSVPCNACTDERRLVKSDTCDDLSRLVLFLVAPEYPMSRIVRLVKDIESCKTKYNLVRCHWLFQGGAGLFEELLHSWIGG